MVRGVAHGRVNLMGEHTDYNRGLVLPALLHERTVVTLEPRADGHVVARGELGEGTYRLGRERPAGDWLDYVRAVTATLRFDGRTCRGFDATIESDVPIGAGVASSAALLVALARAIREAFDLDLDDVALALLAQRAEVEFVGARVGVMDQLAASLGRPGHALFIDTADLAHQLVPIPSTIALVVVDSGVRHAHASGAYGRGAGTERALADATTAMKPDERGDYNERQRECEEAARRLGVASLRDVRDTAALGALDPVLAGRVRHVLSENARVRDAVVALRAGDGPALGALFDASHASQRDDYAVSTDAVDALAEALRARPGVHGARLTGGGFGGAVVAVVRPDAAASAAEAARMDYEQRTGRRGRVLAAL